MKKVIVAFIVAASSVAALGVAQQANQNINVLPVYFNDSNDPSLPLDPEAHLKGDLYLQRQVEPTIAVSTRNPDHLIAFFNDYRAVDIAGDLGAGEKNTGAPTMGPVRTLLAKIFGQPHKEKTQSEIPPQAALTLEAWVGGSRSYDGGLTWSGFFVPGGPFDTSPASLASPVFGLEAATDPVAASAPCGVVYLSWLAFTRGGASMMVVSRYQDLNNLPGGDTWEFQGTAVVEVGNNAENGFFLDKPFLLADHLRFPDIDSCGHNIYLSYTTFNGLAKDGKFKSKVTFARSTGGLTPESFDTNFDVQKLNAPFQQNQGTWIAVDPREGTPNTDGGGTVHLFWRHFFDPDAILTIKSTNFGQTFPGNPKKVTGNQDLETFDQLGISTTAVQAAFPALPASDVGDFISFRSNAFPTAAIAANGKIFVAWQEKVDTDPDSPDFRLPSPDGDPRIVLMKSINGGSSWTDAFGIANQRKAVDIVVRDIFGDASTPAAGFGALPDERVSSHQIMPALSCGGGRCMLSYYESRGVYFPTAALGFGDIELDSMLPPTDSIDGIDRVMDLRAALLDPTNGQLLSTSQVSRYTLKPGADVSPAGGGETVADILPAISPCAPDNGGPELPPCTRSINLPNKPQSVAGTTAFIGDYTFLIPIQSMVPNGTEGWRWAIHAVDVPYQSFRAIWADNRNLIPPTISPGQEEWERYQNYEAIELVDPDGPEGPASPQIEGCPVNWGAKNTDVLTARVDAEIIISAPTTFKIPGAVQVAFPIEITNGTGEDVVYFVTFALGTTGASFTQTSVSTELGTPSVTEGFLPVFAYSTATVIAHVDSLVTNPVQIQVFSASIVGSSYEAGTDLLGSITLNNDGTTEANPVNAETFDVIVSNPLASNPLASNPLASNPLASNPLASNPLASNPLASNYTLTDTVTWEVTSGGATTDHSSALALLNVDNSGLYESDDYLFQVVTYTLSSSGGLDLDLLLADCDTIQVPQAQIISNLVTPPGDVSLITNPLASNPLASNPLASNPLASNPLASNSTLTVAPSDSGGSSSTFAPKGTEAMTAQAGQESMGVSSPDGTLKAPRLPEKAFITLLAYKRCTADDTPGGTPIPCEQEDLFDPLTDPPSLTLLGLACDEPFTSIDDDCDFVSPAPDLILTTPTNDLTDGSPLVARAGEIITFPIGSWTVKNDGSGDAAPENGPLTHAVYLADQATIFLEDGTLDDSVIFVGPLGIPGPLDTSGPLTSVQHLPQFDPDIPEIFAAGATATFGTPTPLSVTIPAATAPGSYHLVLWIDDGQEISEFNEANNAVSVPIEVTVPNTPPIAVLDGNEYTIDEDMTLGVVDSAGDPVFFSATDDEGDDLTYSIVSGSGPSDGTTDVLDPATGEFSYVPDENFNGSDSFDFIANDGEFDSAPATVTININAINDPPVATADQTFPGTEDGPVSGQLLASDAETETTALTFEQVLEPGSGPDHGTLVLNSDGSFLYTPDPNFNGTDTFLFRVCDADTCSVQSASVTVTLTSVEDIPVATGASLVTNEDTPLPGTLVASDGDGDALTYFVVSGPNHGTLNTASLPTFTYTPAANYAGPDAFTFKANDGDQDSIAATISIQVDPINDAPVANALSVSTAEDTPFDGVVSASDVDGPTLSYTLVGGPATAIGSVALDASSGAFTYTPNLNQNGPDAFTFQASDGELNSSATVTIDVTAVNDPPVVTDDVASIDEDIAVQIPVLANDNDDADIGGMDTNSVTVTSLPTFGQTSVQADGNITYTPNPNANGPDTFQYQACDLGYPLPPECSVASVTVTIGAINDAPVALNDGYGTPEDVPLTVLAAFGVLSNDQDVDSAELTATLATGPSAGNLALSPDGSFTYTPNLNFFGVDTFTYAASDGPLSSDATVTITVASINDAPVANDDPDYVLSEGESLVVTADPEKLLSNDTDVDGDELTASLLTPPAHGTVDVQADGGFTYTPDPMYFGSDSFIYEASDGLLADFATATIDLPYGFIGLLSPWKEPAPKVYTIKHGSAFPVRWQYTDPATGMVVESSGSLPEVQVLGPVSCNSGGDGTEQIDVFSPGNSTYQYDDGLDIQQLNVDTDNLLVNKCYDAYVFSGFTQQLDGPFIFKIKR